MIQSVWEREGARAPIVLPRGMLARYELLQADLLSLYDIHVRRWRSSMSGAAWEEHDADGTITRVIDTPRPRGPMSAAIFCHEVGHHAIGFDRYKPRCLEEYHAWAWSLGTLAAWDVTISDRVRTRVHESLEYAVAKGLRRGLKRLPDELVPFLPELGCASDNPG